MDSLESYNLIETGLMTESPNHSAVNKDRYLNDSFLPNILIQFPKLYHKIIHLHKSILVSLPCK